MQKQADYSEILNLINTKTDLQEISESLDNLEASLYETKSDNNFDKALSEANINLSLLIKNLSLKEDKKLVLEQLKNELKKINFVEITFSHIPSQNVLNNIFTWFKNNTKQRIALDIKVDQSLIGGITISSAGKFYDGSLLFKLESILKNYERL